MALTPRAITALLYMKRRREKREMAEHLNLNTLAARGDKNALKKAHEQLGNGA